MLVVSAFCVYNVVDWVSGAYSVVFGLTVWVLVARRPKGKPLNKKMLILSILMFILATMVSRISPFDWYGLRLTHISDAAYSSELYSHLGGLRRPP